jgi:hypothetical protein
VQVSFYIYQGNLDKRKKRKHMLDPPREAFTKVFHMP